MQYPSLGTRLVVSHLER